MPGRGHRQHGDYVARGIHAAGECNMHGLKRGCGKRTPGGIYGCCPTSPHGRPVWDFLVDPPSPYGGKQFKGIKFAPDEMAIGWPEDSILLLDWVGKSGYQSAASLVEEAGRFGLSRKFSRTFPWHRLSGKKVWLALIHARAIPTWKWDGAMGAHLLRKAKHCKFDEIETHRYHCVYTSWLTAPIFHKSSGGRTPRVEMPWGAFNPSEVFHGGLEDPVDFTEAADGLRSYTAGIFAVFPLTKFQVIRSLPDGCKFDEGGQELEVANE